MMQTNPPGDDEDEGGGGPVIIDPKRVSGQSVQDAIEAIEDAIQNQYARRHPNHEKIVQLSYALSILRAVEGV